MSGVFSAFLVAFKHLVPEHRLAILGGKLSIRVKVNKSQSLHVIHSLSIESVRSGNSS